MSQSEADYDVKKLEKLLDRMAEEELSDQDVDELQEILLSSEQARVKYINFNFVDDSLHWSYAEAALDNKRDNQYFKETVVNDTDEKKAAIAFPWAAIAAILAIAFTAFVLTTNSLNSSDVVATVSADSTAKWAENKGTKLSPGIIKLLEGQAKITFASGAEMTATAPVEIDIKSNIYARLIRGKVKLYAPKSAMGFRLETEASNFVDIGTEFEVTVDENNTSEIHVLDGVVVARSNYSDEIVPFGKNEAGRVDTFHGNITPLKKKLPPAQYIAPTGENKPQLNADSRVIFIGERNTDYETYLHMVNQAIYDFNPKNAPTIINAGLTYKFNQKLDTYDQFIKEMNPTHAVLSVASVRPAYNIDHSPEWFETSLTRLCDKLDQDNIKPIIHIGFPVNTSPETLKHYENYNYILFQVAQQRSYSLARADLIWKKYLKEDKTHKLAQAKGLRYTYAGHQVLARSVLDCFGYSAVKVPLKLRLKALPGILKNWQWQEYETPSPITAKLFQELNHASWPQISLPMPADRGHTAKFINPYMNYEYQTKELGFALEMSGVYENTIRAVSEFESEGGNLFLNIGGGVKEIWLNGEMITSGLTNMFLDGRHPGGRRFPVKLKGGKNKIILDCTMNFFVSLTETNDWGLQKPE
ncbi:MAG: hypothetical protein NE334_20505 [Lentisphaeraceae bacterium]|nr:hypothetical protein [Lentisphaeraceae bacterium]